MAGILLTQEIAFDGETNIANRLDVEAVRERRKSAAGGLPGLGLENRRDRVRRAQGGGASSAAPSASTVNPVRSAALGDAAAGAAEAAGGAGTLLSGDGGERGGKRLVPMMSSSELVEEPAPATLTDGQLRLANVCFLVCGIGVAMCWTMVQSGISYFSFKYPLGKQIYTVMLTTYNVPVLPLLILQTLFDRRYDSKYGSEPAYLLRIILSMVLLAIALILIPYVNETELLVLIAIIGVMDSVAYGTASQLFSMFPARAGGFYFIGASLTSLLSIAITFGSGFASSDDPDLRSVEITFILSAVVTLIGLATTIFLVRSPVGQHYLRIKDALDRRAAAASGASGASASGAKEAPRSTLNPLASLAPDALDDSTTGVASPAASPPSAGRSLPLVHNADGAGDASVVVKERGEEEERVTRADVEAPSPSLTPVVASSAAQDGGGKSNLDLLRTTALCHWSLFLDLFISTWVGSLVSYVPSQADEPGNPNQQFKLILVYVGMIAALVGKQFNVARRGRLIRNPKHLLICVSILASSSFLFFLYIFQGKMSSDGHFAVRIDGLIIAYLALFNMFTAYFSSLSYGMAANQLTDTADKAQSSTLLGITLMMGVYAGLGASYATVPGLE